MYTFIYIYTYIYPLDPINHVFSLSGSQILRNSLTYHSVQIFEYCAEDQMLQDLILFTRLCGTGFITKHGWVVNFHMTKKNSQAEMICTCEVPALKGQIRGAGMALKYFYMIPRVGRIHIYIYMYIYVYMCIHVYIYMYIYIIMYICNNQHANIDVRVCIFI